MAPRNLGDSVHTHPLLSNARLVEAILGRAAGVVGFEFERQSCNLSELIDGPFEVGAQCVCEGGGVRARVRLYCVSPSRIAIA